jgi:predicted DNA-binding ribbon-helix-helix protein
VWRGLRCQGDTAAGRARPHRETEAMTPKHRMEQSPVRKRTAKVGTHSTSVSVEEEFWQGLKEIARQRELPVNTLLTDIDRQRQHANLSSAIRLYVLDHYRRLAELGLTVKQKRP